MEFIENLPTLPPRAIDAHKGTFGKICIAAGSTGFAGAAALAGKAALRSGAGLVRIACPQSTLPTIASMEPAYTTIPLPEDTCGKMSKKALSKLLAAAEENDCLAFGPGIGQSSDLKTILIRLLDEENLRIVIDADGLNNLSTINNWPDIIRSQAILTPHPGEMKRLWQAIMRDPLPDDRAAQAVTIAEKANAVVVLKGAGTVVTNGKKVYVNKTGNPGMATAGSGDVLTGMITALAGQVLGDLNASILGVYIHGLAGDIAAQKLGQISLTATDIIDALPQAFIKHQQLQEKI